MAIKMRVLYNSGKKGMAQFANAVKEKYDLPVNAVSGKFPPEYPCDKERIVILAISAMTVCVMCPMMSFVATALFKGVNASLIPNWIQTTALNFPMALCWQIFFAGPLVRMIFGKMFPEK